MDTGLEFGDFTGSDPQGSRSPITRVLHRHLAGMTESSDGYDMAAIRSAARGSTSSLDGPRDRDL